MSAETCGEVGPGDLFCEGWPGHAGPHGWGDDTWGEVEAARRALVEVANGDRWGPGEPSLDDLRIILAEYDRLVAGGRAA